MLLVVSFIVVVIPVLALRLVVV